MPDASTGRGSQRINVSYNHRECRSPALLRPKWLLALNKPPPQPFLPFVYIQRFSFSETPSYVRNEIEYIPCDCVPHCFTFGFQPLLGSIRRQSCLLFYIQGVDMDPRLKENKGSKWVTFFVVKTLYL